MSFFGTRRALLATSRYSLDATWNVDAAGNWSAGSNWNTGKYPYGPSAIARFLTAISANRIVTLDINVLVGQIFIGDDQNYTLAGTKTLTVDGGSPAITVTSTGAPTISAPVVFPTTATITNTPNATISGIISGAGGITKAGAGILTLSGVNTYTGPTTINAGSLAAGSTTAFGSLSTVSLADVAGAQMDITGFANTVGSIAGGGATGGNIVLGVTTLTAGGNNLSTAFNGVMSGTGASSFTKVGTGTLQISRAQTFTGTLTLNGGVIQMTASIAFLPAGTDMTLANTSGVALDINGFTVSCSTLSGGGASGGNLLLGSGTLTVNHSVNVTFSGIISGTGGNITKSGVGTWTVAGANTYTGVTRIIRGTLSVATLNSVSGGSASSNLGVPSSVTNGTLHFGATTNPGTLTYTGTGETTDRVLNLAGTTGGGVISQSGTGLLKFTSANTATVNGAKTLTLQGSTAGTGEISGVIVDSTSATSLTKTGTGTWTLSATNTYTGATTVSQGILSVTGSTHATSAVTVSGGTLLGTGTVNGTVTVANVASSIIAGGLGAVNGTLNTGALTFSGSTAALNVYSDGAAALSVVNVTGAAVMGGATVNLMTAMNAGTYNIITTSGGCSGTAVAGTNNSGRTVTSITSVGNNLVLVLT